MALAHRRTACDLAPELRELIRRISRANSAWGSPRIVGELAKLGIVVAQWTAQQMVEAFPFDTAPRYLIRDRDGIYADVFRRRVRSLDMEEVITAPRSPWQNPYAERVIGTLRRECLDNVIVLHERHLRSVLGSYIDFHHRWRVHQSLELDAPEHRPVQPPTCGEVVEFPDVGGLQRHYERRAA